MAATANQKRKVALELVDNVAALKTAVDAINTVTDAWTLDGADNALPSGSAIKTQIAAFNNVTKASMSLADDLVVIMAET